MNDKIFKKNNQYSEYFDYVKNPVFPKFLIILFSVELWERFSYYGLRSLLSKYLLHDMNMSSVQVYNTYSLYAAIGYALPILGGILADKLLGFIQMILIGASIIAFGHFVLFFSNTYPDMLFWGLALIAIGTGFFKGNITNLLGLCYNKDNKEKKIAGFTLFYVSVNVGSFAASIICGYAKKFLGQNIAFSIAGIGMLIGLTIFYKNKHIFAHLDIVPPQSSSNKKSKNLLYIVLGSILSACLFFLVLKYSYVVYNFFQNQTNITAKIFKIFFIIFLCSILYKMYATLESTKEKKNVLVLFIFVIFYVIFYMYEMHLGSLFLIFMDQHTNNSVLSVSLPSEVSQAINPMTVMIFGFFMSKVIKSDVKSDITNFFLGIATITICFGILFLGTKFADGNGNTKYIFSFLAIVAMSIGEILIAPFIQSKTTDLAPKKWKGSTMGLLMGSLSVSNILGGVIFGNMFSTENELGEATTISHLESLEIYSSGFLKIIVVHSLIAIAFLLLIPLITKMLKNSQNINT